MEEGKRWERGERRREESRGGREGSVVFFFQAEDGIRDYKVTGVQTCALPISGRAAGGTGIKKSENKGLFVWWNKGNKRVWLEMSDCLLERVLGLFGDLPLGQIGRASCRERV